MRKQNFGVDAVPQWTKIPIVLHDDMGHAAFGISLWILVSLLITHAPPSAKVSSGIVRESLPPAALPASAASVAT